MFGNLAFYLYFCKIKCIFVWGFHLVEYRKVTKKGER